MAKQAMYILRTPLQQCLHRVRDKGAITRPCHGKVVGAYVHMDDPYRVHPVCPEHAHELPHQWPEDKSVWVERLDVQAVQEKLISIKRQRGLTPVVRREMVIEGLDEDVHADCIPKRAMEDIGGAHEPANHFE